MNNQTMDTIKISKDHFRRIIHLGVSMGWNTHHMLMGMREESEIEDDGCVTPESINVTYWSPQLAELVSRKLVETIERNSVDWNPHIQFSNEQE